MADKTQKMIRIKWVRSGIGFTHHQKTILQSLGLNKLNHTVVRPDTPQIRGIVAAVPHLLEIVPEPPAPAWAAVPEYTIHAPAAEPQTVAKANPAEASEAANATLALGAATREIESASSDQGKGSASESSEPAQASRE